MSPFRVSHFPQRFIFCGTFRRIAPPWGYQAPCPVQFGLSSSGLAPVRDRHCNHGKEYTIFFFVLLMPCGVMSVS